MDEIRTGDKKIEGPGEGAMIFGRDPRGGPDFAGTIEGICALDGRAVDSPGVYLLLSGFESRALPYCVVVCTQNRS